MKIKSSKAKICTIGANCKSTCISGSYNCLKIKGSEQVKLAVAKIGSLGFFFSNKPQRSLPDFMKSTAKVTGASSKLFGNSLIGGMGQVKGLGETGLKFPVKDKPDKSRPIGNFQSQESKEPISIEGKKQLGSGFFGRVYDNKDGTVTKQLKSDTDRVDYKRDVQNQNLAANFGLAPRVLQHSEREIVMEKAVGRTVAEAVKYATDKEVNEIVKAKSDVAVQLHRAGIAHNDSHNSNVYYDATTNKAQYIDFGLSKSNATAQDIFADYKTYHVSGFKVAYGREFNNAEDYQAFLNE